MKVIFPASAAAANISPMKKRTVVWTATLCLSACAASGARESRVIFNGKDLSGWRGNTALWSVKDGAITGTTLPSSEKPSESTIRHNTFLVWDGKLRNFDLTLKYRITAQGNSGIQFRSRVLSEGPDGPIVAGYQADLDARNEFTGTMYDERGRFTLARRGERVVVTPSAAPESANSRNCEISITGRLEYDERAIASIEPGSWVDYRIVARGNHLQYFINGQQTIDVIDEDSRHASPEGILAFQIHTGAPMAVQFKDIRLKTFE